MRVYEALAQAFHANGPNTMFGLVGDGNVKFADHWQRVLGAEYVAARHEAGAVSMAAGYARSTGEVGVVTLTQGPGITNGLTALTAAARARVPLVLFTAYPPVGMPGHPQAIDQASLMAAAGIELVDLDLARVDDDVKATLDEARRRRCALAIAVPTNIQDMEVPAGGNGPHDDHGLVSTDVGAATTSSAPELISTADVRDAARCLAEAKRPILVAGRGVLRSPGARETIEHLADQAGALLATTLPAREFFRGHPFHIGVMGGYGSSLAAELLGASDCVVTFGASLNYRATQSGHLLAQDATIVQCDIDADPAGGSIGVDVRVTADAADAAAAISDSLPEYSDANREEWRTASLEQRLEQRDVHASFEDQTQPGSIDPRTLMLRLDGLLPRERSVTVDGGHSSGFPSIYLDVPDQHGYLFALEFAAIGLGLGNAIGAAVARPDRLSVLVVGDGSLLMSLPDVETAAREGIPLLIVVMNDDAYGSELHILANGGLPPDLGLLETPSFASVAESLGGTGLVVRDLDDLDQLSDLLDDLKGPLVLDCAISRDVTGPWLRGAFTRTLDRAQA